MAEGFKLRPEECLHEHLTEAATMNDETHIPRFWLQCRDCGQDQNALPAFLRARAEEDLRECDGWGDYESCQTFSKRRALDAKGKIALVDEYEDLFSVAVSDDRTEQRLTLHFVLEHLAATYRDHKDYRPEWAPYEED